MENNNPAPQTTPSQPTMQQNPQPTAPSGGSKMFLWIILGLIVTILIIGGVYWYLNNQQSKTDQANTSQTQSSAVPVKAESSLQTDLNSIEIPDVDNQFATIDKDINSL